MTDLVKFAEDLTDATRSAKMLTDGKRDEGTFNFDSLAIFGVRWSKKVEAIVGSAGHVTTWLGRRCILVSPPNGNAGLRLQGAEEMTRIMRERGWDVSTYYQMD